VTAQEKSYQAPFRIVMLLASVAMLGWVIPYGFASHTLDKCNQDLQARNQDLQARLDVVKARIDSHQKVLEHR
jgi:hypothetical protein